MTELRSDFELTYAELSYPKSTAFTVSNSTNISLAYLELSLEFPAVVITIAVFHQWKATLRPFRKVEQIP